MKVKHAKVEHPVAWIHDGIASLLAQEDERFTHVHLVVLWILCCGHRECPPTENKL